MTRMIIVALPLVVMVLGVGVARQSPPPPPEQKSELPTDVAASPHVRRGVFASAVVEREPADQIDTLTTQANTVCFFTEIVDMEGKTVTHRWIFDDETKADVSFEIGGPRWRVYSSKKLIREWVGTWTVEVVDGEGNTLHRASFVYKVPE